MVVAIAQGFKMPDLEAQDEVEILIPSIRIIPGFGVVISDGNEDEKKQAICPPYLPRRCARQRRVHSLVLPCEPGWNGVATTAAANSLGIVTFQSAACPIPQ